ncbi:MAG: arginase, partial [Clostridia bacterium]|nr:arginase [Clostridia bacterium]
MNRKIDIIGIQMDLGASKRGVDMGPGAIRHAGLLAKLAKLGYDARDRGD